MNRRLVVFVAAIALVGLAAYAARDLWAEEALPGHKPVVGRPMPEVAASPAAVPAPGPRIVPVPSDPKDDPAHVAALSGERSIRFVRDDGKPIRNAEIMISDARGSIHRATSDATGVARVRFAPRGAADVKIMTRGAEPITATVSLGDEVPSVSVPTGLRIAGVVTVDGAAPRELLAVRLQDGKGHDLETTTEPDGTFEFFNLKPGWSASLLFPIDYRHASAGAGAKIEEPRVDVVAPEADVRVVLVERSAIRGRLVQAKEGAAPTRGRLVATSKVPAEGVFMNGEAREDGRFRIIVPDGAGDMVLRITDTHGFGAHDVQVAGPIRGVREIGDFPVNVAREITLAVKDASGAVIKGARGRTHGGAALSEPTDDRGRARIYVEAGPCKVRVGKLGYATADFDVPSEAPDPLEVRLSPGNQLSASIELAGGTIDPRRKVYVILTGPGPIFTDLGKLAPPMPGSKQNDTSGGLDVLLVTTGATNGGHVRVYREGEAVARTRVQYLLHDRDPIVAGGFTPGAEVSVRLMCTMTEEILQEHRITMGATDRHAVTLRSDLVEKEFRGVLVDERGEPVARAKVSINDGLRQLWTDANGGIHHWKIFADTLKLEVEKEGFQPLRIDAVPVPGDSRVQRFVLAK